MSTAVLGSLKLVERFRIESKLDACSVAKLFQDLDNIKLNVWSIYPK